MPAKRQQNGSVLVPAVVRAALILDELAAESGPVGVSELARRLSLPKSSVLNICNTLVDVGLARRRQAGFCLGGKVVQLGAAYLADVSIVREFQEVCLDLSVSLEETMQLAVLDEDLSVVYLARRDGTHPVRLASDIGRRLPATCTAVGLAMLAQLPTEELRHRLPVTRRLPTLTSHSIGTTKLLVSELERIRSAGYAIDDEQTVEGVVCVAAALPAPAKGDERAAVSFTLLKARASPARLADLAGEIRAIAGELGDRLGRSS